MFANWTIGAKLTMGFGLVVAVLIVLAVISVGGLGGVVGNASEVIDGNKLKGTLIAREVDHLNWANDVSALITDKEVHELRVETDHTKCKFGQWLHGEAREEAEALIPSLANVLSRVEDPHRKLHESAVTISQQYADADAKLGNFLREKKTDHLAWAHRVKDAFVDDSLTEIEAEENPRRCSFGAWYYSADVRAMRRESPGFDAAMAAIEEPHRKLHESVKEIEKLIQDGKMDEAKAFYMSATKPLAYETLGKIDDVLTWQEGRMEGLEAARRTFATETKAHLGEVQGLLEEARHTVEDNLMTDQEMLSAAAWTRNLALTVSGLGVIAAVALAWVIRRQIVKSLTRIIDGLSTGSKQVAAAANQVSDSSQSMAQGASEQASSLEESSASLEEMTSMTKQNSESAGEAERTMNETSNVVQSGIHSMERMREAMNAIKQGADETAKIIKTIDDVAFQTNLLALNAAVEAARAGEAGKGFAVVAEEVRNLAQRSADAAKETTSLIEQAQGNAESGVSVTEELGQAFERIHASADRGAKLIAEISAATKEQSQGIDQINTAVSQMDTVTQQNAADSEEAASASEELNAQANELNEMVEALVQMAGGVSAQQGDAAEGRVAGPGHTRQALSASTNGHGASAGAQQQRQYAALSYDEDDYAGF